MWKAKPEFVAGDAELTDIARFVDEPHDARLVIGDAALLLANRLRARGDEHPGASDYPYVYDLGEMWKGGPDLPFVFAVWVAQRTRRRGRRAQVHARLIESRDWGLAHLDVLAEQASTSPACARRVCLEYLSGLDYGLSYEHLAGLTEFFRRLAQRGHRARDGRSRFSPQPDMRDLLDFYHERAAARARRRGRSRAPAAASAQHGHVHRRPQHQLHERLRRRLRLLRVLSAPEAQRRVDALVRADRREDRRGEGSSARVQILMQGGHNPYIPFEWYLELLRVHQEVPPDPHPRLQPERGRLLREGVPHGRARRDSRAA